MKRRGVFNPCTSSQDEFCRNENTGDCHRSAEKLIKMCSVHAHTHGRRLDLCVNRVERWRRHRGRGLQIMSYYPFGFGDSHPPALSLFGPRETAALDTNDLSNLRPPLTW